MFWDTVHFDDLICLLHFRIMVCVLLFRSMVCVAISWTNENIDISYQMYLTLLFVVFFVNSFIVDNIYGIYVNIYGMYVT